MWCEILPFFCRIHYTSNWETNVTAGVLILERGRFSKTSLILFHMSTIIQQGATIYSLFISVSYSTCFGLYLRPSSGAHNTASQYLALMRTLLLPVVDIATFTKISSNGL